MTTMPLSVPPDFPDTVISFAMSFWAQDVDIPVDIVWQDEHANFASELSQHPSVNCSCLSKPLQELMVTAVRADDDGLMMRSTCCVAQMHSQTAQEQLQSQTKLWQTAPPCQSHQQQQLWQPQTVRQAAPTSRRVLEGAPCSPWGGGAQ